MRVGDHLEAIKIGMDYPDGNDDDLDAGYPDQRAPSQQFVS